LRFFLLQKSKKSFITNVNMFVTYTVEELCLHRPIPKNVVTGAETYVYSFIANTLRQVMIRDPSVCITKAQLS